MSEPTVDQSAGVSIPMPGPAGVADAHTSAFEAQVVALEYLDPADLTGTWQAASQLAELLGDALDSGGR